MPMYTFDCEGFHVEHFYTMATVPPVGDEVVLPDGRRGRRLFEPPGAPVVNLRNWEYTSYQMEPYHPDAPRVDANGHPVFRLKREVVEFVAKNPKWRID